MNAKTYVRNICSNYISKPKSYAYSNGRACREHPEAIAANSVSMDKIDTDIAMKEILLDIGKPREGD